MKYVENTQMFKSTVVPLQIKAIMKKPIAEYHLRGLPYLPNSSANHIFNHAFTNKYGGIKVILAPPGSGKTTYLRKFANRYIHDGGYVQYYASELKSRRDFFLGFGDEGRAHDLFHVLPNNSVIILDQVEQYGDNISDDLASLLRHLALESRRTIGNNVVVSTSSLKNAAAILSLNGNDKIKLASPPLDFKWDKTLTDNYIDLAFQHWNPIDTKVLRSMAVVAACPGFLYSMHETFPEGPGTKHIDVVEEAAKKFQHSWEEVASFQTEWKSAISKF